jgi:hypothetical protein
MFGKAKGSPLTRRVSDLELRANCLTAFENWRKPIKVEFKDIIGEAEWKGYWELHNAVVKDMKAAQQVADALRKRVEDSLHAQRHGIQPQPFLAKDESCEFGKLNGG